MTAGRVEIHPEALAEAAIALDWYSDRSARAAAAFLSEVDKALQSISNAPQRWPIYEENCRRYPLFRFPYFIVYREKAEHVIQIVAVAHSRRLPGYWHGRI